MSDPSLTFSAERHTRASGFAVRFEITAATPSSLQDCLVVTTGVDQETMSRVATPEDIVTLRANPLNRFTNADGLTFTSLTGTRVLRIINPPAEWQSTAIPFGLDGSNTYAEFSVNVGSSSSSRLVLSGRLPGFRTGLTWEYRTDTGTVLRSGVAGATARQYTDTVFLDREWVERRSTVDSAIAYWSATKSALTQLLKDVKTQNDAFEASPNPETITYTES